jgi:hypothetical protein
MAPLSLRRVLVGLAVSASVCHWVAVVAPAAATASMGRAADDDAALVHGTAATNPANLAEYDAMAVAADGTLSQLRPPRLPAQAVGSALGVRSAAPPAAGRTPAGGKPQRALQEAGVVSPEAAWASLVPQAWVQIAVHLPSPATATSILSTAGGSAVWQLRAAVAGALAISAGSVLVYKIEGAGGNGAAAVVVLSPFDVLNRIGSAGDHGSPVTNDDGTARRLQGVAGAANGATLTLRVLPAPASGIGSADSVGGGVATSAPGSGPIAQPSPSSSSGGGGASGADVTELQRIATALAAAPPTSLLEGFAGAPHSLPMPTATQQHRILRYSRVPHESPSHSHHFARNPSCGCSVAGCCGPRHRGWRCHNRSRIIASNAYISPGRRRHLTSASGCRRRRCRR